MCPVLFHIGPLPVSGYWAMTVLGLAVTYLYLYLSNRRSREKLPTAHLNNLCCLCILSIFLGGILMGLLVQLPALLAHWDLRQALSHRAFYGGLLMLGLTLALYLRHYRLDSKAVARLFVPACPLFMVFGRLGCFLGGCCYGVPIPWGVTFPAGSLAPAGVPLFPSQLAEAAGQAVLFFLLLRLRDRVQKPTNLVWLYIAPYSLLRFVLEFGRGDTARGFWWLLSTSQWLSLGLLLLSCCLLIFQKERCSK